MPLQWFHRGEVGHSWGNTSFCVFCTKFEAAARLFRATAHFDLLFCGKADRHLRQLRLHAAAGDACRGEHTLGRLRAVGRRVLVREVDDLADAALDDRLAALVAGEERDIDAAALERRARVEDRVQLGMHDVGVFLIGKVARPPPRIDAVVAAVRHAVVADADDVLVLVHNARADLRVRILAPVGREDRYAHKVFVPRDDHLLPLLAKYMFI